MRCFLGARGEKKQIFRTLVDPPHYGSIGCQIFKSEGINSGRFLNQVFLDFLYNGGVPTK